MQQIKFIFCLAILFTTFICNSSAQDSLFYSSISFSAGTSYPYGKFKSTDVTSNKSGYAITGTSFLLDYDYKFNSKWGANVNYFSYSNPINITQIENYYNAMGPPGFKYTIENNDSGWTMGGGSFGITYKAKIDRKNKFLFKTKIAVALANGNSPGYTLITQNTNGQTTKQNISGSRAEVFFLNVGLYNSLELDYFITKRLYAKLCLYHLLKNEGLTKPFLYNAYSFNFSTLNPCVGIGLLFGKNKII